MSKFVCDYGTVKEIAKNLDSIAEAMKNSTGKYYKQVNSDLESWSSDAKNAFNVSNTSNVVDSATGAAALSELANFINSAADSIKATDEKLASKKI